MKRRSDKRDILKVNKSPLTAVSEVAGPMSPSRHIDTRMFRFVSLAFLLPGPRSHVKNTSSGDPWIEFHVLKQTFFLGEEVTPKGLDGWILSIPCCFQHVFLQVERLPVEWQENAGFGTFWEAGRHKMRSGSGYNRHRQACRPLQIGKGKENLHTRANSTKPSKTIATTSLGGTFLSLTNCLIQSKIMFERTNQASQLTWTVWDKTPTKELFRKQVWLFSCYWCRCVQKEPSASFFRHSAIWALFLKQFYAHSQRKRTCIHTTMSVCDCPFAVGISLLKLRL